MNSRSKAHETRIPSPSISHDCQISAGVQMRSKLLPYIHAPCVNRTRNLMIKSQIRDVGLARTGSAQPSPAPLNLAALVPQTPPIESRTSRQTHTGLFSIPDPFADEKIWEVYGWVL